MAGRIKFALSLSLSGAYAAMGRQAQAALGLSVADINQSGGVELNGRRSEVELECVDDQSDSVRCAQIYRSLCSRGRADLILGPYSSRLARVAAPIVEEAGMVMLNHSGADDALYAGGAQMLVGVLSPASDYLRPFVTLLCGLKLRRKRLAIVAPPSGFGRAVADGIAHACAQRPARRKGVRIRVKYNGRFDRDSTPQKLFPALKRNRVNAVVSAGSYRDDVELMRAIVLSALNVPVLACVAAGLENFGHDLGQDADGIVGPSQWEEEVGMRPELGPTARAFASRLRAFDPGAGCDCPAAQAYAAAILAKAAIERAGTLEQARIREAFADLRASTLFGDFAIDRVTGRQIGHKMLLVQWHQGRKIVIEPEPRTDSGAIEFPSGWKLVLASLRMLKLTREGSGEKEENGADDGRS